MQNKNITKIDKNLAAMEVRYAGMKIYDINKPPFRIYGLCRKDGENDYKRLPHEVAVKIDNESIRALYTNTAGGRIRFRTNSRQIILRCGWPSRCDFPHMPMTGTSCFDLYADGVYCNVFRPGITLSGDYGESIPVENGYQSGYCFPDCKMRDILIHFPLYNDISQVWIALEENAEVLPGTEYAHTKPIVFYGSSITQGGCASHAGNAYQAIISRRLDTDYINFGFSGGCRAELETADYLASLAMRVFVYDYDHNAPNAEFLEQTHERFFQRLRAARPDLPILMISAADGSFADQQETRKNIIRKTYENALASGDKNVYFLDGSTIYQEVGRSLCTVDNCHPNDLGFWCMAKAICRILQDLI